MPATAQLDLAAALERYGPRLRAVAYQLVGADADDVVQETFLRAVRKAHTFRAESEVGTWLHAILVRVALRHRRKRARGGPRLSLDAAMPIDEGVLADPRARGYDPSSQTIRREATQAVQEAIARLPDAFRVPLVLKEIGELPVEDVARIRRIKPQTVKTRVHRARMLLRGLLDSKLPRRRLPAAAYERRICVDLLAAKQAALDRGERVPLDGVTCERCRAVFATLDLGSRVCHDLARGDLPPALRRTILAEAAAWSKEPVE